MLKIIILFLPKINISNPIVKCNLILYYLLDFILKKT